MGTRWKPQRLRPPSANYIYSRWTNEKVPDRQPPIVGEDFVPNETYIASLPNVLVFPERKLGKGKSQRDYNQFRVSWLLIRRDRPCVPCPEMTPLPGKKDSKPFKAKLFSVYLRPWTMVQQEATVDVPYLADLDLCVAEWQKHQRITATARGVIPTTDAGPDSGANTSPSMAISKAGNTAAKQAIAFIPDPYTQPT